MMEFLQKKRGLDGASIIYEVKIPCKPRENVYIDSYKVSQRPQNSHPLVNGGFSMKVMENKFEEVKIFYGGISDQGPQEMAATEEWMEAKCTPTNLRQKLPELFYILKEELKHSYYSRQPTSPLVVLENIQHDNAYRMDTACNIFFKYLVKMAAAFQLPHWNDIKNVSQKLLLCSYVLLFLAVMH